MSEDYKNQIPNNNNTHDPLHNHNIGGDEEEFGNELGGARASLQLGNKNQPNDVDVEAAVLKLVGSIDSHNNINNSNSNNNVSTGNNHSGKKRKLQYADEITTLNEFQQWTGFLEEELSASTQNSSHHQHQQANGSNGVNNDSLASDDVADMPFLHSDGTPSATGIKRSKKSKKKMDHMHEDPELSQLDSNISTADHEQLVQAAIMNARELENEFGPINVQAVSDYFKENAQNAKNKNSLDQQLQEQAAQAVVAAAASAGSARNGSVKAEKARKRSHKSKKAAERSNNENADIVAEVVDKSHSWASTDKAASEASEAPNDNVTSQGAGSIEPSKMSNGRKYKKRRESISQPSSAQQGKTFRKLEIEAIDNHILAFCQINNITREQMCQRIWSNKRQKDNFWESLQKVLPQRTRASLYKHVRRSYHIFQVRGKWKPEEDQVLGRLALENPGNWKLIGEEMGRMPEDCRDRYRNYVKCGSNRSSSKWSEEEETSLKMVVTSMLATLEKKGETPIINWTLVSEQMNGKRSRIQCRYKWNKLMKGYEKKMANNYNGNGEQPQVKDGSSAPPSEKERQVWLLSQLKNIYSSESEIEWDIMFTIYPYGKEQDSGDFAVTSGQSLKEYYDMIKLKYFDENYKFEGDGRSFADEMDIAIKKVNDAKI